MTDSALDATSRTDIEEVVESSGSVPDLAEAADNPNIEVHDGVQPRISDGSIELLLPAAGSSEQIDSATTVFDDLTNGTSIQIDELSQGVRTMIAIEGPNSPTTFSFEVDGVAALRSNPDGSVSALDVSRAEVGFFGAPWATDAAGNAVSTRFEVHGTTLVQIVEHGHHNTYPVVADPSWWAVTKCVAAIAWVVGSTIFAASKITKIKELVKVLRGVKTTAKLLLGGTFTSEKFAYLGQAMVAAAASILGVAAIQEYCL
jgi:hypothetical protein